MQDASNTYHTLSEAIKMLAVEVQSLNRRLVYVERLVFKMSSLLKSMQEMPRALPPCDVPTEPVACCESVETYDEDDAPGEFQHPSTQAWVVDDGAPADARSNPEDDGLACIEFFDFQKNLPASTNRA